MEIVKSRSSEIKRINENIYRIDIEVMDSVISLENDVIKQIVINNGNVFDVSFYLVEKCKVEKKYALYLDVKFFAKEERILLIDNIRTDYFHFVLSLQPFYTLKANVQKVLLLIDESAILESLALLDYLSEKGIEKQVYMKAEKIDSKLRDYLENVLSIQMTLLPVGEYEIEQQLLSGQFIGTHVFIAGEWIYVQRLNKTVYSMGYGEEDVQYSGYGLKEEKVFCVKCCILNNKIDDHYITCQTCHSLLDVTDRYSKSMDAYLGYIYGGKRV